MDLEILQETKVDLEKGKGIFTNIIQEVMCKGSEYLLKALPVNPTIKTGLYCIKNLIEGNNFKGMIKKVTNSSINEGKEILKVEDIKLEDIKKLKEVSLKGGLKEGICNSLDIAINNEFKNNIFYELYKEIIKELKSFINSKDFLTKIDVKIEKIQEKIKLTQENIEKWFKAYDKLDFSSMDKILKEVKKFKNVLTGEILRDTNLVENLSEILNIKREKLSNTQIEVCKTI